MSRIQVHAGESLLASYVRNPLAGVCELIWNGFDEDATLVTVSLERNDLGGIDRLFVADDGRGMDESAAIRGFQNVGDSWKRVPGAQSADGRHVHGRLGRGRYAAYSLGGSVVWKSTAQVGDDFVAVTVRGTRSDLSHFDVEPAAVEKESTGTTVVVGNVTDEAVEVLEQTDAVYTRVLTEFALHLDRYPSFAVEVFGKPVDARAAQRDRRDIPLVMPEGCEGTATLIVIDWDLRDVERRLYLCSSSGAIVDEMPPGIQAPGAEFTAYLQWGGFDDGLPAALSEGTETPIGRLIGTAKRALREYLSEQFRRHEAEIVSKWRDEGVYPYEGSPVGEVEVAKRQVFNVVAMAAARTVEDSKSQDLKRLSLELLKEAFEKDPEAVLPILMHVTRLPRARVEELRALLERTSLADIIHVSRAVADRLDFVQGLAALIFDTATRKTTLERRQLHRILARETWIFGEEWSLTGDDERLTEVLKKYLKQLGNDAELADVREVRREDGSTGIPDLVLGRKLRTGQNEYHQLVVELKRPNHRLADEDVTQLRSYASAIVNDEQFSQPNVTWSFWLVGNDTMRTVDEARRQRNQPHGVVQAGAYTLIVKTWAEVVGDAEHRLKFVEESLNYASSRDAGLEYLRLHYAEYLPEVVAQRPPSDGVDVASYGSLAEDVGAEE